MIQVENLTKIYGKNKAVDDISFELKNHLVYGFLGPNGAGKTTTLNIITGYLSATSGKVLINGYDILEEPEEAKRCIGYLPEQPPVYLNMLVSEYLSFAAELKGIPANKRKSQIGEVMDVTRITDVKDRMIKHLSKGYRQRVGFAQAILGYPEIIILDEPTVGLDPKQIIEIRELIKSLGQQHTVIFSSHILSEVNAISDHILVISKGRIVASDTPDKLKELTHKANIISITAKGSKDDIEKTLSEINGVNNIALCSAVNEFTDIEIHCSLDRDIREDLFYAFGKAGHPIISLTSKNADLEDVFLELTSDNLNTDED